MRAHPVKALNLIQDSTRHRWHEATATKTAAGPSATYNCLRSHGLDCSGPDGGKGSIERLAAAVWPPRRPAVQPSTAGSQPSLRALHQSPVQTRLGAGRMRRPAVCVGFSQPAWRRRLPVTGPDRCSLDAAPMQARFLHDRPHSGRRRRPRDTIGGGRVLFFGATPARGHPRPSAD